MLVVHHLNNSRSQRIIWLLEELELEYQIEFYLRDFESNLAPPELAHIHPLGKSPMLTDAECTIIESGAIIDYIIRNYGRGRLAPAVGSKAYEEYVQWLFYGEGGAVVPLVLKLYTGRLPDGGAALQPRITSELDKHLGYLNTALEGVNWFVGNEFTAADIQLTFVIQVARMVYSLETFPNLERFLTAITARDAYKRALERGGEYSL